MSLQKTAEKLKRAKTLKEEGNAHYKAGNTREGPFQNTQNHWPSGLMLPSDNELSARFTAFRCYYESYLHINGLDSAPDVGTGLPEPMQEELRQTLSVILSNIAAVHAKNKNWPKVIDNCTKALARHPKNTKAFFRRGQAYLAQGALDGARSDFESVLSITSNDPETQCELNKVKELEKQQKVKQKRDLAGMFDRTKEEKRMKTSSTST